MSANPKKKKIAAFEKRIRHEFKDVGLLREALTHASAGDGVNAHNERLEFLGDRVLGLVIADVLLENNPDADEGTLARTLNALVRKEACVEVAKAIGLGDVLILDEGEEKGGGRKKKSVLGNACEALIAALYRDGGFKAAKKFILREWEDQIERAKSIRPDAKTALQEWAHARLGVTPFYKLKNRKGPDHAPEFTVEVNVGELDSAKGRGGSKREAEQDAALNMLKREGAW